MLTPFQTKYSHRSGEICNVEVICKIQTMYVTNLRSGLEYIVKEQNDLAKDYYKKIAQPVRV